MINLKKFFASIPNAAPSGSIQLGVVVFMLLALVASAQQGKATSQKEDGYVQVKSTPVIRREYQISIKKVRPTAASFEVVFAIESFRDNWRVLKPEQYPGGKKFFVIDQDGKRYFFQRSKFDSGDRQDPGERRVVEGEVFQYSISFEPLDSTTKRIKIYHDRDVLVAELPDGWNAAKETK